MHPRAAFLGLAICAGSSYALSVDLSNPSSIKSASKTIVSNIISLYDQTSTVPGLFARPYYFWESGATFDSLVNYWALTGDDSYVNLTRTALSFQVGPSNNYLPPNQTVDEGNDDQSTWALAAMTAAERQFPAPEGNISWLQLAQNVFDTQTARWDTATCGGGLRWQIFAFNNGYNYKNSMSNGNFAQLAARLARFTGNQTYSDWATKAVTWSQSIGLITESGQVFDGTETTINCTQFNHVQWTSNSGIYIATAAFMSNITGSSKPWTTLLNSLVATVNGVYLMPSSSPPGVLVETACAPFGNCNTDQLAFRAILARALASANALTAGSNATTASSLHSNISDILQQSAIGAAAQCSGGSDGTLCGSSWNTSKWDGTSGLGQDLSALEVLLANLPSAELATASTAANTTGTAVNTTTSPTATPSSTQSHSTGAGSVVTSSMMLSMLGLALAVML